MPSKLDQLRTVTEVVADTGDIEAIRRFAPTDATTNPSLLLKAAALPHYAELLQQARVWAASQGGGEAEQLANWQALGDFLALAEAVGRIGGALSQQPPIGPEGAPEEIQAALQDAARALNILSLRTGVNLEEQEETR